ncbi:40s ribosomal protein s5-1 [Hordeum vulgare]|nr:40s ribosomal protein s5-1 [Hordeum vulgare]
METRLEAMEQQVFKCQGMVERGLNANHTMITEFTSNHKMDAIDIGKHLSRLYDRVDQLQGQIYDLQNRNCPVVAVVSLLLGGLALVEVVIGTPPGRIGECQSESFVLFGAGVAGACGCRLLLGVVVEVSLCKGFG